VLLWSWSIQVTYTLSASDFDSQPQYRQDDGRYESRQHEPGPGVAPTSRFAVLTFR
jgi:hypothetical protein